MTQDEKTIRILAWQNGLYLGMLNSILSILSHEIDIEDAKVIVDESREKLKAPLPSWIQEDAKPEPTYDPNEPPPF